MINNLETSFQSTRNRIGEFIFGRNDHDLFQELNEDTPPMELKQTNKKSSNPDIKVSFSDVNMTYNESDFEYDTSRNRFSSSERFHTRKSPLPLENEIEISTRGSLHEWDNIHSGTVIEPNSRMLLTYITRLGNGEDDEELINLYVVQSFLDSGADFNFTDVYGQSIFFGIVRDWHVDIARFAIERGANVNHRDSFGRTPLHLAAAVNYVEMVKFLVENGAYIDAKTTGERQEPLHFAAKYGSVECIIVLERLGATLQTCDYLKRTPLHIAIEHRRKKATKVLLKLGSPAGERDAMHQTPMGLMIEKLPDLAYETLNQFYEMKQQKFQYHLFDLEGDKAQTVLELIVKTKNEQLILHPVIKKILEVKWNLFGKSYTINATLWAILHVLIATVFVFNTPFHSYNKQFTPVIDQIWKIFLGGAFMTITVIFIISDARIMRSFNRYRQRQSNKKLYNIATRMQYCHPCWPEEMEFLNEEKKFIEQESSWFLTEFWNIYDFVSLGFSIVLVILFTANAASSNKTLFAVAEACAPLTLLLLWFRLYKKLRVIPFISEINISLEQVFQITIRSAVMVLDLYIPYVFVYYMMFGGSRKDYGITKKDLEDPRSIQDLFFRVWAKDFNDSLHYPGIFLIANHVLNGTYYIIIIIITYVYIGILSEQFSRVYKSVIARAYLSSAYMLIRRQLVFGMKRKERHAKYFKKKCNPLKENINFNMLIKDAYKDDQDMQYVISELDEKVAELSNKMTRTEILQIDRFIGVSNTTALQNNLEKIINHRQISMDNYTLLTTNAKNIKGAVDQKSKRK